MSRKIKYSNEPIGEPKIIADFLPSPDQLAFNEEEATVTITLSKKSIEFFKSEAAKNYTKYQHMISQLIDAHVESYTVIQIATAKLRHNELYEKISF